MGFTESGHQDKVSPFYSARGAGHSCKYHRCILPFIVLILLPIQCISGQRKTDIGIIGGTSYYLGDVNHSRHFYSPSPAGGLILRYNINPRNSIRFSGIYTILKGDPGDFNEPYPYSTKPPFTTNLVDLGIVTEFNFMPYEPTKTRRDRYTPYVSGGLGYTVVLGGDYTAALSFGGGFKYNMTTRMSTGFEWSFHKSFSDNLDGVPNMGNENNVFFHNKDWYSIVGVFVTYKIFDFGMDCPAYD